MHVVVIDPAITKRRAISVQPDHRGKLGICSGVAGREQVRLDDAESGRTGKRDLSFRGSLHSGADPAIRIAARLGPVNVVEERVRCRSGGTASAWRSGWLRWIAQFRNREWIAERARNLVS